VLFLTKTVIIHLTLLYRASFIPINRCFRDSHHLREHPDRLRLIKRPLNPPVKLQLSQQIECHLIPQAHFLILPVTLNRPQSRYPLIDTGELLGGHLFGGRNKQIGLPQLLERVCEVSSSFYH
jgi:hypothetical protein